jgi:hypothetical protein
MAEEEDLEARAAKRARSSDGASTSMAQKAAARGGVKKKVLKAGCSDISCCRLFALLCGWRSSLLH